MLGGGLKLITGARPDNSSKTTEGEREREREEREREREERKKERENIGIERTTSTL